MACSAPISSRPLLASLQQQVRPGDWCELAGSLPPGATPDIWVRLARALAAQGAHIVIDTGGAVLLQLLAALADPAADRVVPGTLAALVQGQSFPGAAVFGMACAAARIQAHRTRPAAAC